MQILKFIYSHLKFNRLYLCLILFLSPLNAAKTALPWEPTEFIWNLGLSLMTDTPIQRFPYSGFNLNEYGVSDNDQILWVDQMHLLDFVKYALPKIHHPFILVTNNHDISCPKDYEKHPLVMNMIEDPRLIHWFTQNYHPISASSKISPIPIGIDFHTIAHFGAWGENKMTPASQEKVLNDILKTLPPTDKRIVKVIADFQHSDSLGSSKLKYFYNETRTDIFLKLLHNPCLAFTHKGTPRHTLWKIKGHFSFSISPFGAGMDCHRTWEDLALGLIVIVKTSPLDPLFEGLPVVIIQDWNEITKENLEIWLNKYGDAFENPLYREKLTNTYWFQKIKNKLPK